MKKLLGRLWSPAGFLVVLLLFFLPFVSVSCEMMGAEIGADYTGLDMATNGEPTANLPGGLSGLSDRPGGPRADDAPRTNVQLWTILAAAIVAAGLLTALIAAVRARMIAAASIAGLGIVALIVNQIIAHENLFDQAWTQLKGMGDDLGGRFRITEDLVTGLINMETGFWLAILVLAAIVLGNVGALTRDKWKRFVPKITVGGSAATAAAPSAPGTLATPDPAAPPADETVTPPMGTPIPELPDAEPQAPELPEAPEPPGEKPEPEK